MDKAERENAVEQYLSQKKRDAGWSSKGFTRSDAKDEDSIKNDEIGMEWEGEKLSVFIAQMYEHLEVSFDELKQFCTSIGATECDIESGWGDGGCETCDYGSRYPSTLTFWGWK